MSKNKKIILAYFDKRFFKGLIIKFLFLIVLFAVHKIEIIIKKDWIYVTVTLSVLLYLYDVYVQTKNRTIIRKEKMKGVDEKSIYNLEIWMDIKRFYELINFVFYIGFVFYIRSDLFENLNMFSPRGFFLFFVVPMIMMVLISTLTYKLFDTMVTIKYNPWYSKKDDNILDLIEMKEVEFHHKLTVEAKRQKKEIDILVEKYEIEFKKIEDFVNRRNKKNVTKKELANISLEIANLESKIIEMIDEIKKHSDNLNSFLDSVDA